MKKCKFRLLFLFLLLTVVLSCRKDHFITDNTAKVSFSIDTLTFDTVFTQVGSTTKYFKVYNPHNSSVLISYVQLMGGSASQFRINVDGVLGSIVKDVEILPNDSLYIFVEVTVDPNNTTNPFFLEDEIHFVTNGNKQKINLIAWGQNAHFFRSDTLCNVVWTNDLPYVIFDWVMVDSGCTLTIKEGVRIHSYSSAMILVKGTLIVEGSVDSMVVFQGARLEPSYADVPGQWFGIIILRGSTGSKINYGEIINAGYGVSVGSILLNQGDSITVNNIPDLIITNTIIKNTAVAGIFGFLGAVRGENCLIYNSGNYNVQIELGGIYEFTHCTFVNFSTNSHLDHKKPIIRLYNYMEENGSIIPATINATFTNSIIYGNASDLKDEIEIGMSGADSVYLFENCLLKTSKNTSAATIYKSIIKNSDPQFSDPNKDNYELQLSSPCNNSGKPNAGTLGTDINNTPRGVIPDIGAYETKN